MFKSTYSVIVTTVLLTCSFLSKDISVFSQDQEYEMSVSAPVYMVNSGEDYYAVCQLAGFDTLYIVSELRVKWFHNTKQATTLCLLEDILSYKYECSVDASQNKNFSFILTVTDVEKSDEGNLTCELSKQIKVNGTRVRDEIMDVKSVSFKVRDFIKDMIFKFDQNKQENLTLSSSSAPRLIVVNPGNYTPSCKVIGSTPVAEVKIIMGDTQLQGSLLYMENEQGIEFVANEIEFEAGTDTTLACSSIVPGLPKSERERTFNVLVVEKLDPKFICTNESAVLKNKRHKVTCKVYNVKRITCTKIAWQRGYDGESRGSGNYEDINIECKKINNSMIETTMEILKVTSDDFRIPYYVVYSYAKRFQITIPQEHVNAAVNIWDSSMFFIALLHTTLSIILL
ncbi:uncharacterized protein LOC133188865 [Saccostrea echinata]|uniref:uncharacterized protein LOC133188865 n=1 Tax=Saccostrea echinata TaxID=191078 RepID=UPI002A81D6FF|nr:uncharacterized protein LOC133188865 [Saccostrea echinata]